MTTLLKFAGFDENPFANYSAENEPAIADYFVRPPYYDFVHDRGMANCSVVLFGARGSGKSATRLAYAKDVLTPGDSAAKRPLVVTLDDFDRILRDGVDHADLSKYLMEVGFLTMESILLWLAAIPEDERTVMLEGLNPAEEALVVTFVTHFYLARPEALRHASIREPLRLLKQAWHSRTKLWLSTKWDSLASIIGGITQALSSKWAGTGVPVEAGVTALLKAEPRSWNEAQFARAMLSRLADVARVFGFSGLCVLVDKVDETSATTNSSATTARLVYPLLANTQMLEVEHFSWLFFLWDKVQLEYNGTALPVRLDKIPNVTIAWDEGFLSQLVALRLSHFSSGKVSSFEQLCDGSVNASSSLEAIVRLSMRSPRELIRLLDTIVREHDDEFSGVNEPPLLRPATIDRGLDKYAIEALRRTYPPDQLRRLQRLRLLTFVNKDVQQAFRVNDQTARNRIRLWVDAGMVSQIGTRPAEGGGAGKPSYEYGVTDFRARRALERDLSMALVSEFDDDFGEDAG